ncbi:MAG TPA: BON domain-containing protein [Chitinophagaceae bacterium]|nr:BON domain-containing protein [Chitinophagaceae bacterium]
MKQNLVHTSLALVLFASLALPACKPKDSDIQASINEKTRANAQMSNVSVTVVDGVATLTGQCPDAACKTSAEDIADDVKGVKSVVNNIVVDTPAPVVINDDATITTSVNPIVAKYPGVTADVQNGTVTLRGNIKKDDLQKLMMALQESNVKNVNNQLTIK